MAGFTLEFTFSDDSLLAMDTPQSVRYWVWEGLPDYEGDLEGFEKTYPKHMQELLDSGIIVKEE